MLLDRPSNSGLVSDLPICQHPGTQSLLAASGAHSLLLCAMLLLLCWITAYLIRLSMCKQVNAVISSRLHKCWSLCCDSDPFCCIVCCHMVSADPPVMRVALQSSYNHRLTQLQRDSAACSYGHELKLLLMLTHAATSVKQECVAPARNA
jgi:hypothetical protein